MKLEEIIFVSVTWIGEPILLARGNKSESLDKSNQKFTILYKSNMYLWKNSLIMSRSKTEMGVHIHLIVVFTIGLAMTNTSVGSAAQFEFFDGDLTGNLDTRLAIGANIRASSRDSDLVGMANGGSATSVNGDDGNLNYDRGDIYSASANVTHELDLSWKNFGFFSRVFYFGDVAATDTRRTSLGKTAKSRSVRDIRLLDAYGIGNFEVGNSPLTIRVGNQVINWGESTFIQNGINAINPINVAQLRVAGAELRSALLPVPALDVNIGLTDKFSFEAFYQWAWRRTEIDPQGTYFSTNDFISPGGDFVVVAGAGTLPDNPPTGGTFANRAGDRNARDFGEFGLAFRYLEPALNDTEFGVYYLHYHSRLPLISATRATTTGNPSSATYFTEYPMDIDLVGMSFNTILGETGLSLQGEVSYKFDQPLQVDDQELLISALNLCGIGGRASQLGCGFASGEDVTGYRRKGVFQAQATLTKIWGATFGADQVVFLSEGGVTWVPNLESEKALRYDGPGTTNSGDPGTAGAGATPTPVQTDGFATAASWGIRMLGQLVFNNAIGAVNLLPQIAFSYDVDGTTPSPIGNFVEDRKTITLSLGASYLVSWEARVSYTNFFGGGSFNQQNDRDFVSTVVRYAF